VKIPRWNFEKFPNADPVLGPQMKSVGEAMAIGRTLKEALLKAMRSLEIRGNKGEKGNKASGDPSTTLRTGLRIATADRLENIFDALRDGAAVADVACATDIDPWFIAQIKQICEIEKDLTGPLARDLSGLDLRNAKRFGLSDARIAALTQSSEAEIRR